MNVSARISVLSTALMMVTWVGVVEGQTVADKPIDIPPGRILPESEVLAAKPMVNRLRSPDTSRVMAETSSEAYVGIPGVMTQDGPVDVLDSAQRAYGTFGVPYTTTRVQEGAGPASGATNANRLSTTAPYRQVGKLTFTTQSGNAFCSASVIRRGIIVTAAHCYQDFGSNTAFTNFQFRPGHYGATGATTAQLQPYGVWSPFRTARAATWASGTDRGCGSARENDLALMAIRKDSQGRFIGDRTGWFGYGWNNYSFVTSPKTGNLLTAAVSTLGYPALMDSGRIMQRADGPTYTTTLCSSPTKQLWQGSNFTGGSSGGPWVVNFSQVDPVLSGGAVPGTDSIRAIIGVTSWGSSDPNAPKDNYSSQFAQNTRYPNADYGGFGAGNIGSLLNTLCNAKIGDQTLKTLGYCD